MKHLFRVRLLMILVLILVFGCSGQEKIPVITKGKTSYSIYLDPSAPESVRNAANELKSYFKKVTGASPEIIVASQAPSTPFISLGNTSVSKSIGLDASVIPNDGFRMVTKGMNIFILGPDTPTGTINCMGGVNNGTSNGVYTFIEDYLGVQWLMPGELGEEYIKVNSISIPELDRIEFSPFNYRVLSFRSVGPLEDEWDRHLKLGKVADVLFDHSWIETIPPSLFDKHPDWFAQAGGKPIPPSGFYYKLETINPSLVQAYADVIIETFRKNPNQLWYSLTPSDGIGWSDSPATRALIEKNPKGSLSVTPLVLKFYNDVAKIVGKEFPDHKLGGAIYAQYVYPPAAGLPKLEPNLALMLAHPGYGFLQYRPSIQVPGDNLMKIWGESSKKDGFDLYYYDAPISLMMPNGIIWPSAPDILNSIFSRLISYGGFKGGYIYGNPVWPVFGPGNYTIAKMLWKPDQDAAELLHNYYKMAYGAKTAPYIKDLYNLLDTAYRSFNIRHVELLSTNLTHAHLKEIYGPYYKEIEDYYLKARAAKKEPRQQQRLDMFGQVLSLMQWNLRELGLLSSDYKSPITRTADEIDSLMSIQHPDFQITKRLNMALEAPFKVEEMASLADATTQRECIVPVSGNMRILLHIIAAGEVRVIVKAFKVERNLAEFVRYTLTDAQGKQLRAGVISEGRTIVFNGEAGNNYFIDIPTRGASMKLKIDGASIAYRSWATGFQISGSYMDGPLPLYFYVPKRIKSFNITLGTRGAVADIFSPDGRQRGQMNDVSRLVIPVNDSRTGFWKVEFHKFKGSGINLTLDEQLPQWLIPDPAHPLKILPVK